MPPLSIRAIRLLFLPLIFAPAVSARLQEVPLERRIDGAGIIVEGSVVESVPFFNADRTMIHTAHRIRVYKVFKNGGKGAGQLQEIKLVTPGGRIEDRWHVVEPSLQLEPGATGIFFADPTSESAGSLPAFVPHADKQGFVRYDKDRGIATDPFATYGHIFLDLYAPIEQRMGRPHLVLDLYDAPLPALRTGFESHSISGFSPSNVQGGVQDILTINGSGFGTFTGSATIFFDDADDGIGGSFGSIDADHVVAWTDSQIHVYVPNRVNGVSSGTGSFIVRDSGGGDTVSPGALTVDYALNEILSSGLFRVSAENENGRGGYTFKYGTDTANNGVDFTTLADAMDRVEESVSSWNCATGWNADVDGTTTISTVGDDGVNILAFDNDADPLPGGVLGRASSFFTSCGGDTWHVSGVDVRFKRDGTGGINWYYGANPAGQAGSETDFMSVALHELGHAVQHGHINDAGDVMYFSLTTGTNNRTLSPADTAGGTDIVTHSAGFGSCGTTGMLDFDCLAAPTANFSASPLGGCGTSLSVDFNDLSLNGPTSWSWDFGDTGVSGARNPSHNYASQGLYTVSLDVSNANGNDSLTRDDYVVVTSAPVAASCNPTFAGHNNCCSIGILNVTLSSIDRTTQTNTEGDPLQEDFSCSDFTVLTAGTSYPISIQTGNFNNENVHVYVDWDNDGMLTAGELSFSSSGAMLHAGNINVPAGAVTDTALRMRVLSDFSTISTACENIEFGQVEEYSILVVAASSPPGAVPGGSLTVTRGTVAGDVDLSWSASPCSGATDYTIHEGTIGNWYDHTSVECSTAGATSFSGLTPNAGDRYFLVVPVSADDEGDYGSGRPVSTTTCKATQDATVCP